MKNKGFTLVEVIAVVGLLSLIALISVPSVTNYLKNSKKIETDEFNKNLYAAAEIYVEKNKNLFKSLNNPGGIDYIDIPKLIDEGYLLEGLKNPNTGDVLNESDIIKVIVLDSYIKEYTLEKKKTIVETVVKDFKLTSTTQEFIIPENGYYKIELWGGSGGDFEPYKGGLGAYTAGEIYLSEGEKIYIQIAGTAVKGNDNGGYNGGSSLSSGQYVYGSGGGGSSDIRIVGGPWDDFESIKSRIMVAAGGGGANDRNFIGPASCGYGSGDGGAGGALEGFTGKIINDTIAGCTYGYQRGTGGTQTSPGKNTLYDSNHLPTITYLNGFFGKSMGSDYYSVQSGSGNGYYSGSNAAHAGAGGGSSFISGHTGSNAIDKSTTKDNIIHTNQPNHYSSYIFRNTKMIDGNSEMPTHDGLSKMTGNKGAGYGKITRLSYTN